MAAFLPFIAGRLQFRRLFWFGIFGFIFGAAAYFTLSLLKVGLQTFSLLPFIAFSQLYVSFFGLGVIVEFGRYVFRKLLE